MWTRPFKIPVKKPLPQNSKDAACGMDMDMYFLKTPIHPNFTGAWRQMWTVNDKLVGENLSV